MVYVFFANGFEEVEAIATVDVLRRADIEVKMIGVEGYEITGGHGISIKMDADINSIKTLETVEMMILPGGVPGIHNLKANQNLEKLIKKGFEEDLYIAAICAAPSILHDWGLIDERKVTAYPSYLKDLNNSVQTEADIVVDGKLITGKGVGVALEFALRLVSALKGDEVAEILKKNMVMPALKDK